MHYYTYVVLHPLWNMFYVGVRQSRVRPEDDNYWGSSKYLDRLRRMLPHGWEKHILSIHDTRAEAEHFEYLLTDPIGLPDGMINRARGGLGWKEKTGAVIAKLRRPKSDETRERMRKSKSQEHRAKIAAAKRGQKGLPLTEHQRAALVASHMGKQRSEETKRRIAEANRLAWATKRRRGQCV